MPYTIFAPDYDQEGNIITDQRELRYRHENRPPDADEKAYAEMETQKQVKKLTDKQSEEREEQQRISQAALNYGILPENVEPLGLDIAKMLDTELEMDAKFEAKKQELAKKYQGPDAPKMALELDAFHRQQEQELLAQFASNEMAEQAVSIRNQEYRLNAATWVQETIKIEQEKFFEQVNQKCNAALAKKIVSMQPEQIAQAITTREHEMRALGRSNEEIEASKSILAGAYFENLATTNPGAFFDTLNQPKRLVGKGSKKLERQAKNYLSDLAKAVPQEQITKLSQIAEKAGTSIKKKESDAKISLQQQEIMQKIIGLDAPDQRAEVEKISAGLEDKKEAEVIKTRLHLQLNYQEKVKAAKDWQTGEHLLNEDSDPLQKLDAIQGADISDSAKEALTREMLGEAIPDSPENQQATFKALQSISKGKLRSEQDLYALCQQENLTREQAALLKEAFTGGGKINGVPVEIAINSLLNKNSELAYDPDKIISVINALTRNWPDALVPTYKNVDEQVNNFIVEATPLPA